MSLHVGLYTGLSAIRAGQAGIGTVSHNISNASTPGYTRQRVDLQAAIPFDSPDGKLGTGVEVDGIRRLRDAFVDARVRTTAADFAYQDVRSQLLSRTEAVMGEPDGGITVELNKLWNAFDDLAIEPNGVATRRQVVNQLEAVASRINGVATAWDQLATDTGARLDASVAEANQLMAQVVDINTRVAGALPGTISNDLLDQRDLAVDRLAELTGARATAQADGTVHLSVGSPGTPLVDAGGAHVLTTSPATATDPARILAGGVDVTPATSGEIGAMHAFVHTTIVQQRDALTQFTADLATQLNAQHAAGQTSSGAAGGDLLTVPGAGGALVTLAAGLTPDGLAAGTTAAPLDGTNAAALAGLRSSTPVGALDSLIVDLGARVAGSGRAARAAGDVAVAAETARQSQHGVSIDEEMVDLVRYQRQLEAASRVMTAIDQALDTLVNRVGIVGR